MNFFREKIVRPGTELDFWDPVVISAQQIGAEVDRLAEIPRPTNGRRESAIVHPQSGAPGLGLAPGIDVTLSVLLPGERTLPIRHNSTQVNFCISGQGHAVVGGQKIDFRRYDVWNHPSYATYWHVNDGDEIQVRLTYSNAPVLEKLKVHVVDDSPDEEPVSRPARSATDPDAGNPFGTFALGATGAHLMPYETLINPPAIESPALHWPWLDVQEHLNRLTALGATYRGRRLYLLFNPSTGRTNGTTPSFFATMTIRPAGIVDRPHRHISAAINYFFAGSGHSVVASRRYEWAAGDLMLSAPGWAVHHHASGPDPVYELTIQDQPFHIGTESLLWQEDLGRPPVLLGTRPGFHTNRPSASMTS